MERLQYLLCDVLLLALLAGGIALQQVGRVPHALVVASGAPAAAAPPLAGVSAAAAGRQHPVPQLNLAVADADAPEPDQGESDVASTFHVRHLVTDLDGAQEVAVQALQPCGLLTSKSACIS